MIKVFISGPMTGIKDYNRAEFMEAEKLLKEAGYSVFNPARLDFDDSWSDDDIASIDMAALCRCDAIYQLDNWDQSRGATAEYHAAKWMHLDILDETDVMVALKHMRTSEIEEKYTDYLEGGPKPRTKHRFW